MTTKQKSPTRFYVYAYMRTDGTPYYIGKGTGRRLKDKKTGEVRPPTDSTFIIFVERNLTNIGALALERRLIKWYGRKDLGTGILRNKTDGGDGGPGAPKGCIGRVQSKETKDALSLYFTGRKIGSRSSDIVDELKSRKWWNNGTIGKFCSINPGAGWKLGRPPKTSLLP